MKQLFKIYSPRSRSAAIEAVRQAPDHWVVEIKQRTRSLDQNAKFHAICSDVSKQATWLGKKISPEQWKVLFISGHSVASGVPANVIAGLEGEFVNIRESSACMGVARMSSLIEYVLAWCAENEVLCSFQGKSYANKNE